MDENVRAAQKGDEILRRQLGALAEPAENGDEHGVRDEVGVKQLRGLRRYAALSGNRADLVRLRHDVVLHEAEQKGLKVLAERVLAAELHQLAVEIPLAVEIAAQRVYHDPALVDGSALDCADEFRLEDPLHEGVFVLKVIGKGLAAYPAGLADVADAYLFQRLAAYQLLEGESQRLLCQIGFRHAAQALLTHF